MLYAVFLYALDDMNYIVSCNINFCCNSWRWGNCSLHIAKFLPIFIVSFFLLSLSLWTLTNCVHLIPNLWKFNYTSNVENVCLKMWTFDWKLWTILGYWVEHLSLPKKCGQFHESVDNNVHNFWKFVEQFNSYPENVDNLWTIISTINTFIIKE